MPLSVIIHTKNAASTITRTLKSVSFADEVVIIDMESSDETVALARDFTDKIYTHADEGYADPARNFGLGKATHPWILVVDADEEVSDGLRGFVLSVVTEQAAPEFQADVYAVPRQNFIFGQWIEHSGWWPDYQIRFFKKGHVKWERGVHRQPDVEGKTLTLPATEQYAFRHFNYESVEDYIARLNRYTSLTAEENTATSQGLLSSTSVIETVAHEFNRRYFAEKGYLDGVHGLSLAFMQSFYQLTVQLKEWQSKGFPAHTDPEAAMQSLQDWRSSMAYWIAEYQVNNTSGLTKLWWMLRRKLKY
jgi:glycosyltransferase involved in cell wall biosynthesis